MSATSEFLGELKHRKVIGAVVIYGAVAWLTIEMITVLVPLFGGAEWLVRTGVVIVMLGFPVSVVVSWLFDFNPRTLRLEASLDAETSRDAEQQGDRVAAALKAHPLHFRRPAAVAAVFALLLIGISTVFWGRKQISATGTAAATIAVLPFVDTSLRADNEYLADGLTDELINTLAQVDGLRVAARTSSFAYKGTGTPVRQIADELGVRVILAGSIRQDGDHLRIHAQLVNAADGYNLWAMSYERTAGEIFTVQADIVRAVMQQLRTGAPPRPSELVRGRTDNVEAYHQYLRGRYFWHRRDDPQRREENLRRSLDYFQHALAADPSYALAHAGLADSYASLAGRMPPDEA
jgi:TolB-like protein